MNSNSINQYDYVQQKYTRKIRFFFHYIKRNHIQTNLTIPHFFLTSYSSSISLIIMSRQSTNFQVTELLEATNLSVNPRQIINDFGNFVYTDHVTRKRYDVNKLKAFNSSLHQTTHQSQLFMLTNRNNTQHDSSRGNAYENTARGNAKASNKENTLLHGGKGTKSMGSMPRIEKRKIVEIDEHQSKKWELSHFLQELKMMNRIRENRNHIVSGTQKAQKRKSMLPSILPSNKTPNTTVNPNIDTLKQQIRLQVNSLSTQLFRQYIQQLQPYRQVFNQLNNESSKGALNRNKIKQIKQKIKQCTMQRNDSNTTAQQLLKRTELDEKDDKMFEEYFAGVQKQIGEEIGFKMRHQASYNWKYGKKSTVEEILKNYQSELTLNMKDRL